MMDLLPINENIIIEIDKDAEVTKGGMVIAHSKGERTASKAIKGKIVAIAADIEWVKESKVLSYKGAQGGKEIDQKGFPPIQKAHTVFKNTYRLVEDQIIWVAKWEGQELSYNGKEYIIIKPEHVLAVLPIKNT